MIYYLYSLIEQSRFYVDWTYCCFYFLRSSAFGSCSDMQYFVSFYSCNHIGWEERTGCFTDILVTVSVLWIFFMVPWAGLLCVIVEFRDHTHLFF